MLVWCSREKEGHAWDDDRERKSESERARARGSA